MPRKTVGLPALIRRLKKCLDEVSYRTRAARWAGDGLRILEDLDFEHAETLDLVARVWSDDGSPRAGSTARARFPMPRSYRRA